MSLEIRTALPGDVSAVALLVADLGSPQQVAVLPARIAQLADTPTDVVLVVEFDGRVVGVLRACASRCSSTSQGRAAHGSPRWWYIPACRGAGIGGRLL